MTDKDETNKLMTFTRINTHPLSEEEIRKIFNSDRFNKAPEEAKESFIKICCVANLHGKVVIKHTDYNLLNACAGIFEFKDIESLINFVLIQGKPIPPKRDIWTCNKHCKGQRFEVYGSKKEGNVQAYCCVPGDSSRTDGPTIEYSQAMYEAKPLPDSCPHKEEHAAAIAKRLNKN